MTNATPDTPATPKIPAEAATETYLRLKSATAAKLGQRATGNLHYELLCDQQRSQLLVRITHNESGGYFSRELVPFDKVQAAVAHLLPEQPFPSKMFKDAFTGKSQNNAGFLACVLRSEGVLSPIPDKVHLHRLSGDCAAYAAVCLKLPGESVEISVSGGQPTATTALPADTSAPIDKQRRKDKRKALSNESGDDAQAE